MGQDWQASPPVGAHAGASAQKWLLHYGDPFVLLMGREVLNGPRGLAVRGDESFCMQRMRIADVLGSDKTFEFVSF